MAESSISYNGWANYFEVGEFSVFWLIIETVLDEENLELGFLSLDGRIQELSRSAELLDTLGSKDLGRSLPMKIEPFECIP